MPSSSRNSTSRVRTGREGIARALLNLILIAAVGYGLLVAAMYFAQRTLIYPGAALGGALEGRFGWGELVEIVTPDGERLAAIHAPAEQGRPTLLFFHGNADRIDRYGFLALQLAERGIGFLAVSYRGFAGSTGSPSEAGLLVDGLAAFDWLAARSADPIISFGQSLGSGVAVHVAAERPASALILISAFDSILEMARRAYFFLPVAPLLKDTFRSDLRIAKATQPKLFVHGRRDAVIPIARGQALHAVAPEPKTMVVLEGFGHNDIWGSSLVDDIVGFVEGLD